MSPCSSEGPAQRWHELMTRLNVGAGATASWWEKISGEYNSTGRHYHTLHHICELLQLADEHAALIEDMDAVQLAIFFHDVVYDARRGGGGKNERQSAECFRLFFTDACAPDVEREAKVSRWIEATAHHKCEEGESNDGQLFMDFDMAVIGWPPERYTVYAQQVRAEYSHVPYPIYCRARAAFLLKTAQGGRIFHTEQFAALEEPARANARQEAAELHRHLFGWVAAAIAIMLSLVSYGLLARVR